MAEEKLFTAWWGKGKQSREKKEELTLPGHILVTYLFLPDPTIYKKGALCAPDSFTLKSPPRRACCFRGHLDLNLNIRFYSVFNFLIYYPLTVPP